MPEEVADKPVQLLVVDSNWLLVAAAARTYIAAAVPLNAISYGGQWTLSGQTARAGAGARLDLHFRASDVYIVLGGRGHVTTLLNGKPLGSIDVSSDRLYTVFHTAVPRTGLLELRFSPGIEAFSFTFG